jgi:hypothetical protein
VALNFPSSPTIGQVYTDATSGFSYEWNGTVWRSYSPSSSSQIKIIDDISGSFNGATQSFPLTTSGFALSVVNNASLRISLGGVIQSPGIDYSVSGTNIVFTTAPESSLSFSGISLGPAVPVIDNVASVYVKQTYTATAGQTNFNFTAGYTVGFLDVYQNGVRLTAGTDFTAVGGTLFVLTTPANISDEVEAIGYKISQLVSTNGELTNLNVTGISTLGSVTVSSGIVTATEFDISGSSNTLTAGGLNVGVATASSVIVGSAVTINSSGINVTGITTIKNASGTVTIGIGTTALLVEGNARITGILTVGTGSITLDGTNNSINLGEGLTLSPSGITGTASSVTSASVSYGLTGTPSITVGIATVNTTLSLVGNYIEDVNAVGALNIDCSAGNYFTKTIEGDSTFTVSNVPVTGAYAFTLELTHTSGTVTWFSGVEWPASTAPTLTTGKTHLFMFVTDNGGTRWRGSSLVDYTN